MWIFRYDLSTQVSYKLLNDSVGFMNPNFIHECPNTVNDFFHFGVFGI